MLHPSSTMEITLETIPTLQFGQEEVLENPAAVRKRQINLCRSLVQNITNPILQITFSPLDGLDRTVKASVIDKTAKKLVLEGNITLPIWRILDVQAC